jgi:hypothetical protein
VHTSEIDTCRGQRRLSAIGMLDKPETSEQRAVKPIAN